MAILEMHSSNSYCSACRKVPGKTANASPRESGHLTLLGYGKDNGQPGCGEPWTEVKLRSFRGISEEQEVEGVKRMYPNLAHLPIGY